MKLVDRGEAVLHFYIIIKGHIAFSNLLVVRVFVESLVITVKLQILELNDHVCISIIPTPYASGILRCSKNIYGADSFCFRNEVLYLYIFAQNIGLYFILCSAVIGP